MESYLGNIHKNILGTTSFELRIEGMRKNQDFIVYPIQSNNNRQTIQIQSDTRIGIIDMTTGKGKMSKFHSSGAYDLHLQTDKLKEFELRQIDLQALKLFIFTTQSKKAGNSGIMFCDNSKASEILS